MKHICISVMEPNGPSYASVHFKLAFGVELQGLQVLMFTILMRKLKAVVLLYEDKSSCAWHNVVNALPCAWHNVVKPMDYALA